MSDFDVTKVTVLNGLNISDTRAVLSYPADDTTAIVADINGWCVVPYAHLAERSAPTAFSTASPLTNLQRALLRLAGP